MQMNDLCRALSYLCSARGNFCVCVSLCGFCAFDAKGIRRNADWLKLLCACMCVFRAPRKCLITPTSVIIFVTFSLLFTRPMFISASSVCQSAAHSNHCFSVKLIIHPYPAVLQVVTWEFNSLLRFMLFYCVCVSVSFNLAHFLLANSIFFHSLS